MGTLLKCLLNSPRTMLRARNKVEDYKTKKSPEEVSPAKKPEELKARRVSTESRSSTESPRVSREDSDLRAKKISRESRASTESRSSTESPRVSREDSDLRAKKISRESRASTDSRVSIDSRDSREESDSPSPLPKGQLQPKDRQSFGKGKVTPKVKAPTPRSSGRFSLQQPIERNVVDFKVR